ncbi:MAG: hypothetical protein ACE5HO_20870 [bacterium]
MPQRTLALTRQRIFFSDLSAVEELVLTTKNEDRCALNIHGRFELFDQCWRTAESPQNETLLALREERETKTPTEVPRVHFHVHWPEVRWARIQRRRLDLIDSDFEVVFCSDRDLSTRIFWFYLRDSAAVQSLRKKWGEGWIDLIPPESRFRAPYERMQETLWLA